MKTLVSETVSYQSTINHRFQDILPRIRRCAEFAFRNLKGDHREEAVQDVIVQCYFAFARLMRQGRGAEVFPTVLARYAVRRYRAGRRASGPVSRRDLSLTTVQSPEGRSRRKEKPRRSRSWQEMLVEDRRTPIPDQVSFRVDFPEWLRRLSPHQRRLAEMFASGDRPADVAQALEVSQSRVSQMRKELRDGWEKYQQEEIPVTLDDRCF